MGEKDTGSTPGNLQRGGRLPSRLTAIALRWRAELGLLILATTYTLYFARSLLIPLIIALLLASCLQPLIQGLNRARIPDPIGAAIVVLLLLVLVVGGIYHLVSPTVKWINRTPTVLREVEAKLEKIKKPIERATKTAERLEEMAELGGGVGQKIVVHGSSPAEQIISLGSSFLREAASVIILLYFVLGHGRRMFHLFRSRFRDTSQGAKLYGLLLQVQKDTSNYLRTYTVISAGVAFAVTLLMMSVGLPNPALWGVVAGMLNYIPYLGPATMLGIITLVSILSFETWAHIALAPVVYFVVVTLEGNLLTPLVMGSRFAMNPLIVFVSMLFWGWIWGIPGFFLAVPILTALRTVATSLK